MKKTGNEIIFYPNSRRIPVSVWDPWVLPDATKSFEESGKSIHTFGDTLIYKNHFEQLELQLSG